MTTKDNRIRGIRQVVPTNTLIGRIDPGSGKPQYIDANRLRRMLGPGFVKAISAATAQPLTNNHIFVGNASNVATDVAMSGDATIVASGALTLANTAVTPGSYGDSSHVGQFTADSKGRLTAATNVAINITEANLTLANVTTDDVSITKHGFAPKAPNDATKFLDGTGAYSVPAGSGLSATLTNTHIFVGNAGNVATDVAASGDLTLANTGAFTIANAAVTYAKMQNISAASLLLGRGSVGGAGSPQEITLGTNLAMSGTTLNASAGGGGGIDISPFSDGGITKPAAADFTIADDTSAGHGTGSVANLASRGVILSQTRANNTTPSTQSWFYEAAVSNTLVSMTVYVQPNLITPSGTSWFFGIGVRDNTGKIDAFGIRNNSSIGAFVEANYTNISTVSTLPGGTTYPWPINNRPLWLRLQKVGSNFVFSASFDGENYVTISTTSATAFVGATLNDVGILIVNNLGVANAVFSLDCFSFTKS